MKIQFKRAETCDVCIAPAYWKFEADDELGITEKPVRLCSEHLNLLVLFSLGYLTEETKKKMVRELNTEVKNLEKRLLEKDDDWIAAIQEVIDTNGECIHSDELQKLKERTKTN
jgi:hypothetical protein